MGGRGSASGGGTYIDGNEAVGRITGTEKYAARLSVARMLIGRAKRDTPAPVQTGLMSHTEEMVSVSVEGMRLQFQAGDKEAPRILVDLAESVKAMPGPLRQYTKAVTLTGQTAAGHPTFTATSGAGDGVITIYGTGLSSALTIVHEAAHNFTAGHFPELSGLGSTSFADAVDSGEPTPYPEGGGSIEEDFAESVALHTLDNASFARDYPLRSAAVESILSGKE